MTLSEWRREAGLSQEAFAERIGKTQGFVSAIERGAYSPSLATAVEIERATGGAVPAASWIGNATPGPSIEAAEAGDATPAPA